MNEFGPKTTGEDAFDRIHTKGEPILNEDLQHEFAELRKRQLSRELSKKELQRFRELRDLENARRNAA